MGRHALSGSGVDELVVRQVAATSGDYQYIISTVAQTPYIITNGTIYLPKCQYGKYFVPGLLLISTVAWSEPCVLTSSPEGMSLSATLPTAATNRQVTSNVTNMIGITDRKLDYSRSREGV